MENNELKKEESASWVWVKAIAYIIFAYAIILGFAWLADDGGKGGRMGCYEENGELVCQDPRGN